jgi:hypothetical protein
MIDQKQVENIREFGVSSEDSARARLDILADQIGFRMDKAAEYVIVGGCFQPGAMPSVFEDLKLLLEMLKIDYTFLSKEYCCGWMPVGQPAVMMKNEEDIQEFRIISRELIVENFKQAEALGARSIALFCAACEPNYSNCKNETGLEFISFWSAILKRESLRWKSIITPDVTVSEEKLPTKRLIPARHCT